MATLIGNGAHAEDIASNGTFTWMVPHHTMWESHHGKPIIGVNDPRLRHSIAEALDVRDEEWIHPHAHIERSTIGYGTHINYGVTMTRTLIGHHCTISPGVTICGDVSIGNLVLIGAGATICDRVIIRDGATIGAGAVVLPETDIPSGELWVGVPAKRVSR